ncbi:MAG: ATP-binding protein [Clostridiales bacterium]
MGSRADFPQILFKDLIKNEEQLFLAIDKMADSFAIMEAVRDSKGNAADFIILYINDSGTYDLNLAYDKIIGRRITEVLPQLTSSGLYCLLLKVLNSGISIKTVKAYNGTINGRRVRGKYKLNINKFDDRLIISWRDNTDRIRVEKKLRRQNKILQIQNKELLRLNLLLKDEHDQMQNASAERELLLKRLVDEQVWLNSIVSQMPAGVSIWSYPSGKLIYNNDQANKLLRHPLYILKSYNEHSQFGPMHDLSTPFRQEESPITRALNGEVIQTEELFYLRGDGTYTYLSVNAAPIKTPEGVILAVICVFSDVSRHKEMENALRENQSKLLEAQRLAHFSNYLAELKSGAVQCSKEFLNIFGLDPEANVPDLNELMAFTHPDDQERVKEALAEIIRSKSLGQNEYRIVLRDGSIKHLHSFINPILDESGEVIRLFGTVMDITERKTAQLKHEHTLKLLEDSNKELEQFAFIASHDLREPLGAIIGLIKILKEKFRSNLDESADRYMNYISKEAARMQTLISNLLRYASLDKERKPFKPVDTNAIVQKVVRIFHSEIKKKNAVVVYYNLPEIISDPVQLEQLFQNLIGNALKFTNQERPEIKIDCKKQDNTWLFSVEDNGIGIEPQFTNSVFYLFSRFQRSNGYPGTGIGLSICKKIVERHGGRIWVESKTGKGSTFYFTLPVIS